MKKITIYNIADFFYQKNQWQTKSYKNYVIMLKHGI